MATLRILYDNAADRAAIEANNTAGKLLAQNMQTDFKVEIHRSIGTSVSYGLRWSQGEGLNMVALPATNLSPSATIRVRLYRDFAATDMIHDTDFQYACPGPDLIDWDWTAPLNANAFIFGNYAKTAVYFQEVFFARSCRIDLVDQDNLAGHIDCARVLAGVYWSPQYGAGNGAKAGIVDTSVQERNEAGDLLADRGSQHEVMSIPLPLLRPADRARLMQIFRYVGTAQNFFISLTPQLGMSLAEQDHMIYGKRTNSQINFDFFNAFSTSIEMEGW